MTTMMQDILKLSIPERILMVEAIWDSIENDQDLVLDEASKKLLDQRINAHQNNPEEGSEWADVKNRIKKQFQCVN